MLNAEEDKLADDPAFREHVEAAIDKLRRREVQRTILNPFVRLPKWLRELEAAPQLTYKSSFYGLLIFQFIPKVFRRSIPRAHQLAFN